MSLRKLLEKFKEGKISLEEVLEKFPCAEQLFLEGVDDLRVGDAGRLDPCRSARAGVPEAILAEGKRCEDVIQFLRAMAKRTGCGLATRVSEEVAASARTELDGEFSVDFNEQARTLVVQGPDCAVERLGRSVGILAAGTADVPVRQRHLSPDALRARVEMRKLIILFLFILILFFPTATVPTLTRISHTPSATTTYLPASTALCSVGLLDVVFQGPYFT